MPTANTTPTRRFDGGRFLSPEEMAARRDARVAQLAEMLATRRMTGPEIADALGTSRATASEDLRRLETDGQARRCNERDKHGRQLWTACAEGCAESPATIVPARQVGMWRDYLVAALFGPPAALLATQHND